MVPDTRPWLSAQGRGWGCCLLPVTAGSSLGAWILLIFSSFPLPIYCPHTRGGRKQSQGCEPFTLQELAPQWRWRRGWVLDRGCWVEVYWVVHFPSFLVYLCLVIIEQEGGFLKCLAALGFGEQWLGWPRGLLLRFQTDPWAIWLWGGWQAKAIGYLFLPPGGCSS